MAQRLAERGFPDAQLYISSGMFGMVQLSGLSLTRLKAAALVVQELAVVKFATPYYQHR